MKTYEHETPYGRIVVDYERDENDVYTVQFAGELLRSDIRWDSLRDALQGMARVPTEDQE